MQRQDTDDATAETAGGSRPGSLPGRTILLSALVLAAIFVAAGLWIVTGAPPGSGTALGALAVSGVVLAASLAIGLHLGRRAQASLREAARLRAQARDEARRSLQLQNALLGMVSHELRTPLQTMLANVELLAVAPQDRASAELVQGLEKCIVQLKGRLDNIAQYTRLAAGQVELRREPFLLMPFLRRVVAEHAEAAMANSQTLRLEAPGAIDVQVTGDEIRLHQVLSNFLSNAIAYSGPGTIDVRATIAGHAFEQIGDAEAVEVSVTDHGPGIPEAERQAVWGPFVRGAARSNRPKGSGLGLAIVELLATTASWDCGMRCDADGTTFFVVLPLVGPAPLPARPAAEGAAAPDHDRER